MNTLAASQTAGASHFPANIPEAFDEQTRADDPADFEDQRRSVLAVVAHAARHYQGNLASSPEALAYLRSRGLNRETVRRYGLGFARPVWRDLHRVFRDRADAAVVDSGLVVFVGGDPDGNRFDRFRNRIMFPIRDVDGQILSFGGRAMFDDPEAPKYLNGPETPAFRKGQTLYGLHEAQHAIEQRGSAIIVEGFVDVLQASQAGVENTVATMGTACSAAQLASVLAFTRNVTFCFDGDAAGREAAARALLTALPFATDFRSFSFAFLPEGQDPDSYCREFGGQAFQERISACTSLDSWIMSVISEGCDLTIAEGRARALHQARAVWRALPTGGHKSRLVARCADLSGLRQTDILSLWNAAPQGWDSVDTSVEEGA